jgi:hypothetical protein
MRTTFAHGAENGTPPAYASCGDPSGGDVPPLMTGLRWRKNVAPS